MGPHEGGDRTWHSALWAMAYFCSPLVFSLLRTNQPTYFTLEINLLDLQFYYETRILLPTPLLLAQLWKLALIECLSPNSLPGLCPSPFPIPAFSPLTAAERSWNDVIRLRVFGFCVFFFLTFHYASKTVHLC